MCLLFCTNGYVHTESQFILDAEGSCDIVEPHEPELSVETDDWIFEKFSETGRFPFEWLHSKILHIGVYLFVCIGALWNKLFAGTSRSLGKFDLTLRTYLGAQGMKKGDLSKFIEEAVRWRIFNRTVRDIKSRNADADPDELQAIIDRAVRGVRSKRRTKRKANKP